VKTVTGKALGRALEKRGWLLLRISGSHHIYGRQGSNVRLSIPIHGNKPLMAGLANHLMKTAGIDPSEV
jgi:predicted RNA binding protein YcfA (HicA-like mRNA interferase family)